MSPIVTIIIRTKNRPILLKRAITSVINQSFDNWEIQLVNNGGDIQQVKSVIGDFDMLIQKRINLIHIDKPQNMEVATNIGILKGRGSFIALLDDDDTWDQNFLEIVISNFSKNQQIDGFVTHSDIVYEHLEGNNVIFEKRVPFNRELKFISIWKLSRKNLFTTNSFVYKKSALDIVGLYSEDLPVLGDWEFNIRFKLYKKISVIPQSLAFYHKRTDNPNSNYMNSNIRQHIYWDKKIRVRYFKKYPLSIGLLMIIYLMFNVIIRFIKRNIAKN